SRDWSSDVCSSDLGGLQRRRAAQALLPAQRRRCLHDAAGAEGMIVLGIETSCDETGVGLVRLADDGRVELLANEVASSVDEHARFGGVVPEVASRAHLEAMVPAVRRALTTAGVRGRDVAAGAVTAGPGL